MDINEFLKKYGTDSASLVLDKAARIMGTCLTVPGHEDVKIVISDISRDLREALRTLDNPHRRTEELICEGGFVAEAS